MNIFINKDNRCKQLNRNFNIHSHICLIYLQGLNDIANVDVCGKFLVKEHYSGNKVRNAQVREDLPRARIEQELEEIRYHSIVQEQ